jgi:hypothetical protein
VARGPSGNGAFHTASSPDKPQLASVVLSRCPGHPLQSLRQRQFLCLSSCLFHRLAPAIRASQRRAHGALASPITLSWPVTPGARTWSPVGSCAPAGSCGPVRSRGPAGSRGPVGGCRPLVHLRWAANRPGLCVPWRPEQGMMWHPSREGQAGPGCEGAQAQERRASGEGGRSGAGRAKPCGPGKRKPTTWRLIRPCHDPFAQGRLLRHGCHGWDGEAAAGTRDPNWEASA